MKLIHRNITRVCQENEIYEDVLSLDDKHLLELGCGKAYVSRLIAGAGENRTLVAMEVDQIQHDRNIEANETPNIRFVLAGGENIPEEDETFDVVFMFKSLHHVPMDKMDNTINEIYRVLKPNGIAYISEPVFDGDFNEVLRLFHDEEIVRTAAFNAVKKSVDQGKFTSLDQIFFSTPRHYKNFEDFENRLIKVTHENHQLSEAHLARVRDKFSEHLSAEGADFLTPVRVDLLQKN